MRKWLLCIVVVLCLAVSVSAAETVTLEDAGITLTVPDGYDVLYRNMPEDHPTLEKYGQTTESLNEMLSASDSILFAIQSDYGAPTITVACASMEGESPAEYAWIGGDTMAYELAFWEWVMEETQRFEVDSEWVEESGKLFQHFYGTVYDENENSMEAEMYASVHGGIRYSISMGHISGSLTEADRTDLRELIKSVEFLKKIPEPEKIERIRFMDDRFSASFSYSSTWECQVVEDGSMEYVKMWPINDPNACVFFSETEDFFQLSQFEDADAYDMDVFLEVMDLEQLQELVTEEYKISDAKALYCGGETFLLCECLSEVAYEEFSFDTPTSVLYHLRDNVLYELWYLGTTDDRYYSEVDGMIVSMSFSKANNPAVTDEPEATPQVEETPVSETETVVPDTDEETTTGRLSSRWVVRFVKKLWVLIVAAFGWVVAKVRKKLGLKDKTPAPEKVHVGYSCPGCHKEVIPGQSFCTNCGKELRLPVEEPTAEQVTYACPKCGKKVTPDRAFCHHCGQRMNWEKEE